MTVTDGWGATDTSRPTGFTEERLARARKRLDSGAVSPNGTDRSWVVAGDAKLGDSYPEYRVRRPEGEAHYHCSCYEHTGGDSRGRRICSHVKAVILWRGTPEGKKWLWRQEQIAKARERAGERRGAPRGHLPGQEDGDSPGGDPVDNGGVAGSKPALVDPSSALLGSEEQGLPTHHAALPSDPAHPSWGSLPGWLTAFRAHQLDAVAEVLDGYRSGKRTMFVEAPTGSGKSALSIGVARQLAASSVYLCSTKTLQDQLLRDEWPGLKVLKGRANYPTQSTTDSSGWAEVSCADCTKEPGSDDCRWCPDVLACPYTLAKQSAMGADLTALNYAYALTDWNLARGSFAGRGLAILDEGDVLESELMGFVEVGVSKRQLRELKIGQPGRKGLPKGETVQPEWERWVKADAIPAVRRVIERFGPDRQLEVREIRAKKRWRELARRLKQLGEELPEGGWVMTDYEHGNVVFKPVKVDRYGEANLWRHAQRHLVMSATLISADEMADSLGLEDGTWGLVNVASTFPAANRPIRVCKVADMSYKNRDVAWPRMAEAVVGIARLHPDERILVHSHTYAFAKVLKQALLRGQPNRRIVSYDNSRDREGALERYLATEGAILVGPGMERGLDGADEAVRVNVLTKVPYGFLGDQQVKARMYAPGGRSWYNVTAVRAMVQATGRGSRSETDFCTNYILDSAFVDKLYTGTTRRLFPKWYRDALVWDFPVHTILKEA